MNHNLNHLNYFWLVGMSKHWTRRPIFTTLERLANLEGIIGRSNEFGSLNQRIETCEEDVFGEIKSGCLIVRISALA